MNHFISSEPPHADVRLAMPADLLALSQSEHAPPSTIADIVQSSSWLAAGARALVACVGSVEALESLDAEAHPPEVPDLDGLEPADAELVSELAELMDRADLMLDPEMVTIINRILTRLAAHSDHPLRRRADSSRIAAAIVWLAFSANGLIGRRRGLRSAGSIWSDFDTSSANDIGRAFAEALNKPVANGPAAVREEAPSPPRLNDPALLHSRYRRSLVAQRHELERYIHDHQRSEIESHPVQIRPGEGVRFATNPTTVRWAVRSPDENGRETVMLATGDLHAMHVTSISVPDAHRLIAALEHALRAPLATAS